MHALGQWIPLAPSISAGVSAIYLILGSLVDGPLPEGRDWIDHLDILDAVRVNTLTEFRIFDDYCPEQFPGYIAPGLLPDEVPAAVGGPMMNFPWDPFVEEHELRPGFVRLKGVAEHSQRELYRKQGIDEIYIDAIAGTGSTLFGVGQTDQVAKAALAVKLRAQPTIGPLADWWGRLPHYFSITAVGRALATANAFRLDLQNRLPRDKEPSRAEPVRVGGGGTADAPNESAN